MPLKLSFLRVVFPMSHGLKISWRNGAHESAKHDQIPGFQGVCRKHSRGWDPNLSTFFVWRKSICQANRSKLMDAAKLEPEDHQAEFFRNLCFNPTLVFSLFNFLIMDLVLGSSRVSGSHCNATNSFDGGHWVFLSIHYGILKCHCTLIPCYSDALPGAVIFRTLRISPSLSWWIYWGELGCWKESDLVLKLCWMLF